MKNRGFAFCFVAFVLSGCGGGSSREPEKLYVQFSYPNGVSGIQNEPLQSNAPTITGLNGHTPVCSVSSGGLPQGVNLGSNCVISGTPLVAGKFRVDIKLTSPDVDGFVESTLDISIADPTPVLAASSNTALTIGGVNVNFEAGLGSNYRFGNGVPVVGMVTSPPSGYQLSYQIVSGALPSGLVMDETTGFVKGTPTTLGISKVAIAATAKKGVYSYTSQPTTVTFYIRPNSFDFGFPECPAYWNVPWTCTPTLANVVTGAVMSFTYNDLPGLPQGLTVDTSTGVVSGTWAFTNEVAVIVAARATYPDGLWDRVEARALLKPKLPQPNWGTDLQGSPAMTGITSPYFTPLNATLHYSPGVAFSVPLVKILEAQPGDQTVFLLKKSISDLPLWLSVDTATGRVYGTGPSTTFTDFSFYVTMEVTRNGKKYSVDSYWTLRNP